VCPHRPPCPGCPQFGQAGLAAQTAQRVEALCARTGVKDVATLTGGVWGYRHRARLAVRSHLGAPALGLFERRSHRLVDIPECPIHHPNINRAAAWLRSAMIATRVPPYDENQHT